VIIPTYNRATLVRRAIDSALRAISPGDEIIVVDDGSTDGTQTLLAPLGDRIRFIAAGHRGAGATRNRGVAEAQGDLVAFLDSDDEWDADHLTIHRAVHAARADVVFSFSDFAVRHGSGRLQNHYLSEWHGDARPWSEILAPGAPIGSAPVHIGDMSLQEMSSDYIPTFTLVAKRRALPDATWFAEDVPTFEDLQCFGRLVLAGPAAYIDRETATQHGHSGLRLTDALSLDKIESRMKILARVWGSDTAFMAQHGAAYKRRLHDQYLLRARCLLKAGRTREARDMIRAAGRAPWIYRILSWMPGFIVLVIEQALDWSRGNLPW